jgi:hypothetical protein
MANHLERGAAEFAAAFGLAEAAHTIPMPTSLALGLCALSGILGSVGVIEMTIGAGEATTPDAPQPAES